MLSFVNIFLSGVMFSMATASMLEGHWGNFVWQTSLCILNGLVAFLNLRQDQRP